jgi:hypothetical protein
MIFKSATKITPGHASLFYDASKKACFIAGVGVIN